MTLDMATILYKILLTLLVSILLGLEREIRHKDAGVRTHVLVGLGSMLIVLTSIHIFLLYKDVAPIDPTRMITGVVTGIGFLCAGTIIRSEASISGLTTAATLWIVSCLGIAIGAGYYEAAVLITFIALFMLTGLKVLEQLFKKIRKINFK